MVDGRIVLPSRNILYGSTRIRAGSQQTAVRAITKVGRFKSEYGPETLSKGWGTSNNIHNYTRPGSSIKTALPKAIVTSPGPVNWGVIYATVLSYAALGPNSV